MRTPLRIASVAVPLVIAMGLSWVLAGSVLLHTEVEGIATVLALVVGTLGLVRYWAVPGPGALIMGFGMLGVGLLDAYHAIVTAEGFSDRLPSTLDSLIPWSWSASRYFAAGVLLAMAAVIRTGQRQQLSVKLVGFGTVMTVAASAAFFSLAELPSGYVDATIGRPQDLMPALGFAIAAVVMRRSEQAGRTPIGFVIAAAWVSAIGQLGMSFSQGLFDSWFEMGHYSKVASYLLLFGAFASSTLGAFRDIQRVEGELQDANDELESLVQAKNDFLATITHELRTPLTAVVGFIDVLRDPFVDLTEDERSGYIGTVAEQGFDLVNIVEDLLVVARDDLDHLQVAQVRVSASAQVAQVAESLPMREGQSVDVRATDEVFVLADPTRVRQILRNLMSNASRYGGSRVRIEIDPRGQIRVCDSGDGIPAGDAERVFDQFQRAHTNTGLTESVGIGLAVSRRLARLMGGDLTLQQSDGWTVFSLELPLWTSPDGHAGAAGGQPVGSVAATAQER